MSDLQQASRILRQVLRHRLYSLIPIKSVPSRGAHLLLRACNAVLPAPQAPDGRRLRDALAALGPVYIKLGQLLSTRRDLLPVNIADELATLQDQVEPIGGFDVHQFVRAQLQRDPGEIFASIESTPLASASIAQVHAAQLLDGSQVVIKIVRPGIRTQIAADMALIRTLAQRIHDAIPDARRLHLPAVVADHERVLLNELDMFSEARNQIQLRRNFAESDLLYVPRVHGELTRERMLVMERVYGVPIGNVAELRKQGVDMQVLAHKGVETFFTQVFEHNFFHADMHPGNILIDTTDPSNPRYIALDCAIIGSLTRDDQSYLAQNLMAFFNRDYKRVVALHLASGWVPPDTDPQQFERVIANVCEPIFAKPLAEISFGEFVLELFRTAGQFNMEVQPQLVLLQKTLLYIEGLGRQLYPQLDLWETAQPFMQRWTAARLGPAAVLSDWLNAGPQLWDQLVRLPTTLIGNEAELRLLRASVHQQQANVERIEQHLHSSRRQRRYRRVAGIGFIAASLWLLWQPLAQGIGSGEVTMLAGVVSAFLGSALLIRA